MATAAQVANFIQTIAPLVQKYCKQYGYKVASPIIAQACCESAYGTSWISKAPYYNLFGMKCGKAWTGRSVSARTKEEYTVGTLTSIVDNFRAYDTLEEGVEGYFKFIGWSRYANLKTATTPQQYLEFINVVGITFEYTDDGTPRGLCKANKLYYVMTAGGNFVPEDFGYGYVKTLCQSFYGIKDVELISATGLDVYGADVSLILNEALNKII